MSCDIFLKAERLKSFIESLSDFEIIPPNIPYNHMGATICDAILQAGLKWESVVKPRLDRLKSKYPDANTTSNFLKLIQEKGNKEIIDWQDDEKPRRIMGITTFFVRERIETEADLKAWLEESRNIPRLKKLRGVGDKTADYLKWLVGIPTTAIDRHMVNFLNMAEISPDGYREAQEIIHQTADLMELNRTILDHSIWKYMSQNKGVKICKSSKRGAAIDGGLTRPIRPHGGSIILQYSFNDTWDYLDNEGPLSLHTVQGTSFKASAGIAQNDEPVIKFLEHGREYARAYECCWGHYYNCNRTRFGMYASALDQYVKADKNNG